MENKLYVGNLPYTVSESDLSTLFSEAGNVASVALIKDRETGRSKGFGFIEMSSQAEAEEAIRMFNGYEYGDRPLKVNIARPREERSGGGRRGGGPGQGRGGYNRSGGGRGDQRRGGGRERNRYED
jgi:RNA recognition motif-containing protein